MGALWETAAFILHAFGAHDQQQLAYAITYQILFLLAPLWINAFVYMTFARLVYYLIPSQSILKLKAPSLAKYFVIADIVAFVVQAIGGSMASPGASSTVISIGLKIYMVGIGMQQGFIVIFFFLMLIAHSKVSKAERQIDVRDKTWKPLHYALYGVLLAITVRIIYRIAEFSQGVDPESNPVISHEAYSYVLDAFPMMIALLILAIFHPGRYLKGPDSEWPHLTRADKRSIKMAKRLKKDQDPLEVQHPEPGDVTNRYTLNEDFRPNQPVNNGDFRRQNSYGQNDDYRNDQYGRDDPPAYEREDMGWQNRNGSQPSRWDPNYRDYHRVGTVEEYPNERIRNV